MTNTPSALESLVSAIVPEARNNRNMRTELISHCEDILTSHIGRNQEPDLGYLSDQIKRDLIQSSPSGAASLKFTNLLSRLVDQPVLSRKHASILFLQSLASPHQTRATPFLSSMVIPPHQYLSSITSPIDPTPEPRLPNGKPKAVLLKEYRLKSSRPHLPEQLLLRDALYLLQGISGKYAHFSLQDEANVENTLVFVDDSRYVIPPPTRTLIHRLSEVGYLYKHVESFVRNCEAATGVGMIEQSLCHHLQSQLTEYYRLIAVLESQMTSTSTQIDKNSTSGNEQRGVWEESGLTLRRLNVWINEWRLRMRMMSICVEGTRDTHGGAIVNLIHGYADNGDPFVRKFTDQLLEEVSKPFFATLHKWLFFGELYDPFSEFFVALDTTMGDLQFIHPSSLTGGVGQLSGDGGFGGEADDISGTREGGLKLWETKYRFQKDMLPTFVGEAFGRKIFSTGKSLNFIRYSCHDSEWVVTSEKLGNTGGALKYSDIAGLERSIDAAYQIAGQRLFEVFLGKFKLLDHLSALKNYLMLGHGDFADRLMEALGPSLAKPANTLYRHNLTTTLETAIRSSNAERDPSDVLRRLDARMLEYTHGEIGWDVFTLEYKVDAPIDTVLDPGSMEKYLKIFRYLWQLRRVDGALNNGWVRIAGGARNFLRVPELEFEWHKIRISMSEMIHFIRQMQAYCHLEVIERSWNTLIDFLNKKEGDLDALIDAHRSHLDRIVKKILLLSPRTGKEVHGHALFISPKLERYSQEVVLSHLQELFSTILRYQETIDNFYNYCLSESSRRDEELDSKRGVFTGRAAHEERKPPEVLAGLLGRLKEYAAAFSERAQTIVQHLQVHPDLDCRFLGIMLSFSEFYKSKKDHLLKS